MHVDDNNIKENHNNDSHYNTILSDTIDLDNDNDNNTNNFPRLVNSTSTAFPLL